MVLSTFEGLSRCRHLSFDEKGIATCGIYEEIIKHSEMFETGCILRRQPDIYEVAKELAGVGIQTKYPLRRKMPRAAQPDIAMAVAAKDALFLP